ncbi:dienelactone hydrolase family protein [Undibacterium squillarum]|uniref:Carboxymethylenebutenolidase n=1 Tax=Undibacterium squillarum TaxID=1131567 RepID=A0ABQ2XUQ9_9BURK|nr:dienelactone hydrolase family protein [Undibacterium squillarum]GGX35222.1 carboxymethylenebutenolidase [Undibacterium squillarum]
MCDKDTASGQNSPAFDPKAVAAQWQTAGLPALRREEVLIDTPDGKADAYLVSPAEGRWPAVLMWPDIAGLRTAKRMMADRLAAQGYTVLLVNIYYREGVAPLYQQFTDWMNNKDSAWPMVARLKPEGVASDTVAYVDFLDQHAATDTTKPVSTFGYCLGASYAVRAAAARADRIAAAVSYHGAFLVTPQSTSPDKLMAQSKAAFQFAIGEDDDQQNPEEKNTLKQRAQEAGVEADVQVYPAKHGWCVIDMPFYDDAQSELAWNKMLTLFQRVSVSG